MTHIKHKRTILLALLITVIFCSKSIIANDAFWFERMKERISSIVREYDNRMTIGISFIDINENRSFNIRGGERFPLASLFKVPIMITVFKKIDRGEIQLSDKLILREADKCIGSGILLDEPSGSFVTVERALNLMITISDNTAADLLWNLIGHYAVNELLIELNLTSSNIYISNRPGYLISLGFGSEFKGKSPEEIVSIWRSKSIDERRKSILNVLRESKNLTIQEFQEIEDMSASRQTGVAYYNDKLVAEVLDNYSTPNEIAELFRKLYKGELLSKRSTLHCLKILANQKYNSRIPGMLPKNVVVYHKTGTICGVVNDAGIVQISSRSPVVIAVLIKNIDEGYAQDASKAIARISRAIYEQYLKRI